MNEFGPEHQPPQEETRRKDFELYHQIFGTSGGYKEAPNPEATDPFSQWLYDIKVQILKEAIELNQSGEVPELQKSKNDILNELTENQRERIKLLEEKYLGHHYETGNEHGLQHIRGRLFEAADQTLHALESEDLEQGIRSQQADISELVASVAYRYEEMSRIESGDLPEEHKAALVVETLERVGELKKQVAEAIQELEVLKA